MDGLGKSMLSAMEWMHENIAKISTSIKEIYLEVNHAKIN
jgi:hypothetical protein